MSPYTTTHNPSPFPSYAHTIGYECSRGAQISTLEPYKYSKRKNLLARSQIEVFYVAARYHSPFRSPTSPVLPRIAASGTTQLFGRETEVSLLVCTSYDHRHLKKNYISNVTNGKNSTAGGPEGAP